MGSDAIRTTGLTKRFGSHTAVDAIDLAVPTGSVYGFLGPNGSGKTTTIRMLLGLVTPTGGEVELLGRSVPGRVVDALPGVGALVEGPAFHPYLAGRENLRRLDAADRTADPTTSARRIDDALDRVGLLPAARKRYRAYSLGMRQRLAIAAALLTAKDLMILDEPTNGLDPQGTREVRSLIASFAATGTTVLVSSHLLSEVEQICTHIGVMHAGKLITQGPASDIRRQQETEARVETDQPDQAAYVMRALGLRNVRTTSRGAAGRLGDVAPEKVVAACIHAGLSVTRFVVDAPTLEDIFVSLTGEGFDVSG
jgi:lantibiotic transport system ATP-binding protein